MLNVLGVTRPARRVSDCLTIVTFHRVLPEHLRRKCPLPGLAVTPEELDWHLKYFRRHFRCGSVAQMLPEWQSQSPTERPLLAITFDDGQLDNFEYARPVLARHRMSASFYLPVAFVGERRLLWHDALGFGVLRAIDEKGAGVVKQRLGLPVPEEGAALAQRVIRTAKEVTPDVLQRWMTMFPNVASDSALSWAGMMTWDHARVLAEDGHEIGSHSMSHASLPRCSDEDLEFELRESLKVLSEQLGRDVFSFCYPNGDHDKRVVDAVQRAGYRAGVVTRWGVNRQGASPWALRRCDMNAENTQDSRGKLSTSRLAWRMSGWYPGLG